jgi:hypothetical protein
MQRDHRERRSLQRSAAPLDLRLPREEHEDVPRIARGRIERPPHSRDQVRRIRERVTPTEVADVDRERTPLGCDVFPVHVARDALPLDRRRHHDEVWPRLDGQDEEKRQKQVDVEAPLVELIEDDGVRPLEERSATEHDSRGGEQDPRLVAPRALVANDVPHGPP